VRENPHRCGSCATRQPLIAAVNGRGAGAGMTLALACDIRLASPAPAVLAGVRAARLIPLGRERNSSWPRVVGMAKLRDDLIFITDRFLDAEEARQPGQRERWHPPERLRRRPRLAAEDRAGAAESRSRLARRAL